ncbi:MAG: hypothetical protein ACNS62_08865 [Candidatus Cyclobacteriaceae bacterium M3_2C_046]
MKVFSLFSESERVQITRKRGIFLTIRMYKGIYIELYAMDNFFVEIWYYESPMKVFTISKVFKNIQFLNPYLEDELSFAILQS